MNCARPAGLVRGARCGVRRRRSPCAGNCRQSAPPRGLFIETRKPACKPGSVPLLGTVIYLAGRLLGRSSSLPGSRSGPDRSCSPIWPCSRWGLPSQPVTRLLVGSYPAISPLPKAADVSSPLTKGGLGGVISSATSPPHPPFVRGGAKHKIGGLRRYLSVALSLSLAALADGPWTVDVIHHRVLWSPDFPLSGAATPDAHVRRTATVQPTRGLPPSYDVSP